MAPQRACRNAFLAVGVFVGAIRRPSDLGFNDDGFLCRRCTKSNTWSRQIRFAAGMLFALPAVGLKEQREERRRTVQSVAGRFADLVNHTGQPALVWCHLNEGDVLQSLIPDAVQVAGSDTVTIAKKTG